MVLVAGTGPSGIVRTMQHLRAQTARRRMEVLIVAESAAGIDLATLAGDRFAACRIVEVGPIRERGAAAAAGMLAATSPIVGLIEDHSFPEPEWAEAMLRAHAGAWTGVGPVVCNANPESVGSWVNYVLSYGGFAPPLEAGERDLLPWHNSSYKRAALAPFADRLGALLEWEGGLQAELRARGHSLYLEPAAQDASQQRVARVVHRGTEHAARRGSWVPSAPARERWPLWRRALQAAAFPLFPLLQLRHVLPELRRMPVPPATAHARVPRRRRHARRAGRRRGVGTARRRGRRRGADGGLRAAPHASSVAPRSPSRRPRPYPRADGVDARARHRSHRVRRRSGRAPSRARRTRRARARASHRRRRAPRRRGDRRRAWRRARSATRSRSRCADART